MWLSMVCDLCTYPRGRLPGKGSPIVYWAEPPGANGSRIGFPSVRSGQIKKGGSAVGKPCLIWVSRVESE